MKDTDTYKIGRRKHDSLTSIEKFTFGDNPTISEFDELNEALKDEPKTDDEALNLLYKFVREVMEDKAKELGITEISHKNATEHSPVFFSGLNAIQHIQQSFDAKHQNDYETAFKHLLDAIPALLNIQLLANEPKILAGNSRLSNSQNEAIVKKHECIKLAEPIYKKYLEKHTGRRAGELTAKYLEEHYNIKREGETIRGWFK